jgi:chemotaxis protein CheX
MTSLTSEAVAEITQEIWSALLSAECTPLLAGDVTGQDLVAVTEISGEWNGTVCLSCSQTAARNATAVMFGMSDDELTPADITDAVGELVNVVGGNIKSLVPGPSVLSIPTVSEAHLVRLPSHLELAQEVRFAWMAEPIVVTVWTEPGLA